MILLAPFAIYIFIYLSIYLYASWPHYILINSTWRIYKVLLYSFYLAYLSNICYKNLMINGQYCNKRRDEMVLRIFPVVQSYRNTFIYTVYYIRCALFRDAHGHYFKTLYTIFRGCDFWNSAHVRYSAVIQYTLLL